MHNYPQNAVFLYPNLKLHKMIDMHLKYDKMDTYGIFNALVCFNNDVNSCINCMLSSYILEMLRGRYIIRRASVSK